MILLLKVLYTVAYVCDATLTLILVKKYGYSYESNAVAKHIMQRSGAYSVFLFPLVIGSFFIFLFDSPYLFCFLIVLHLYLSIGHVMVLMLDRYDEGKSFILSEIGKKENSLSMKGQVFIIGWASIFVCIAIFFYRFFL